MRLGVDPATLTRRSGHNGFTSRYRSKPQGAGICKREKAQEAEDAGADYVGAEACRKITGGWLDFDIAIATLI